MRTPRRRGHAREVESKWCRFCAPLGWSRGAVRRKMVLPIWLPRPRGRNEAPREVDGCLARDKRKGRG